MNIEPLFKAKIEEELKKLTTQRITDYYRAEQARYHKAVPWCCSNHCYIKWESPEQWNKFIEWKAYIGVVKSVMKNR